MGISDGMDILEDAMGMMGLGIDSFRTTLDAETREFMTGFATGLNASIDDICGGKIFLENNFSMTVLG